MVVTQHPEPHVRRAVRVLAMVGELHRRGYQKLRVMSFMSPNGMYWRCWIGPDTLFYRNHGAFFIAIMVPFFAIGDTTKKCNQRAERTLYLR